MRTWCKSHRGAIQLYGHSHGTLPDNKHAFSLDVGLMCHNWHPINMLTVESYIANKDFKPIDHHGRHSRDNDD